MNYYTPELEEFHVGFEFEVKDLAPEGKGSIWDQKKSGQMDLFILSEWIKRKEVRVKSLDKEDVLSLGWEAIKNYTDVEKNFSIKGNYNQVRMLSLVESRTIGSNVQVHTEDYEEKVFSGFIKNKSELNRLMKQLEIIT